MAIILVLVCGALGFGSAIVALTVFEVSLMYAFTLWMVGGFVAMLLALLPALLPERPARTDQRTQAA